ncbi:LCP family protein [Amycolatopsis sp. MtRt-6]|uniref:LCP family protein n=1 Tax=Amycolatopsis sp. MtRt-6 TaxID=2792782 RepID=UPI001A8E3F49|nr:LCP family protein [Amycolatopsis sp. MtRt-6]
MADDQEKPEAVADPVTESDDFKPSPFPREKPGPSRVRRVGRVSRRVAVGLVSLLALGASGYVYVTKDQLQSTVPTTDALTPRAGEPAPPPADDGAEDILLVGSDARTDAQGNALPARVLRQLRTEANNGAVNTDTMILLRIPKNGSKPSAVSIPRDTWTAVPGRGEAKINSAYGIAKAHFAQALRGQGERDQAKIERDSDTEGRRVLVQALQDLTQVRIDHYAEINLLGFYLLTEALGGVKVCLNHATEDKDSGANFRRGEQTVSGGEALSFVRQRKNLPRGDLDRIVRQQAFLSSALRQVLSAGTLASPGTLNDLMDAVHRSLTLDPGLDLLQFAQQAKGIASGDLTFATIPVVTANGRSPDGQSIVQVDLKAVREFVAGLAGRPAPASTPQAPAGGSSGGGFAVAHTPATGAPTAGGGSGSGAAPAAAPLLEASPGVPCVN